MKIEKLSNNKLKVIISISDLEKENIDYQSFMSGSQKYEDVLKNLLYIAKNDLNFDTENCNIEIETFEMTPGNFILTITKFEQNLKKPKVKRKQCDIQKQFCIYQFNTFDDYCAFINFLKNNLHSIYTILEKNNEVYKFYEKYILIIDNTEFSENNIKIFNSSITEFATFKSNSKILVSKIRENNKYSIL